MNEEMNVRMECGLGFGNGLQSDGVYDGMCVTRQDESGIFITGFAERDQVNGGVAL